MRRDQRDRGATQVIMLAGMVTTFGLVALAVQVARANDLQTRAETASDAAAIGALVPLRDAGIQMLTDGQAPDYLGLWTVAPNIDIADPAYQVSAQKYAALNNGTVVGKVQPSGEMGWTMKATVRNDDCQRLPDNESQNLPTDCLDKQGKKVKGLTYSSTSIATLHVPDCVYHWQPSPVVPDGVPIPESLICEGVTVWAVDHPVDVSHDRLVQLFRIRLTDHEDPTTYTGAFVNPGSGPAGAVGAPGALPVGTPAQIRQAIAYAEAQYGKPYIWGGTGPEGYDCSGLLYMAYLSAHIRIPRTSEAQYVWTSASRIPSGQEKAGDLVFFVGSDGTPGAPGHVGMVVDPVQHTMIVAPHTGTTVQYQNYEQPDLVGFGRVYQSG